MADTAEKQNHLDIYELLSECASGSRLPEIVSQSIVSYAKSEFAPDAQILSDVLLDTLFLYDSGVSEVVEDALTSQRKHLGRLIAILIVSTPPIQTLFRG